jgi:RNA polymerase sigma factor
MQERQEINKAREELAFELGRAPTEEEVIGRVGISQERYRDVLRMTRPTYSLHSRNRVTQEELINEVTDDDAIGVDAGKHNTLLRLAIDDLVSLLPPTHPFFCLNMNHYSVWEWSRPTNNNADACSWTR